MPHETGLTNEPDILEGVLVKLGPSFGFVRPFDGGQDIFIPGGGLLCALPQDTVQVTLSEHPRFADRREGKVRCVLKQRNMVMGTVGRRGKRLAFFPDYAPDMPFGLCGGAGENIRVGEKAACEIVKRGENYSEIQVKIIQCFGLPDSAARCVEAALFAAGVKKDFPTAVNAEAKAAAAMEISKDETGARLDLRHLPIFTLDSASTKDIDDAISAKKTKDGYMLGVHIADVSRYVLPEGAVDTEAFSRGTSVYYADSVIPMLPRALSNGACSLNAGEDRLAFSCLLKMDEDANVLDYCFEKTLIRSRLKGVYSEVNALFGGSGDAGLQAKYADVQASLVIMNQLYQKLAALRKKRGAVEIESAEAQLRIDIEGRCVDVQRCERGIAECMIEEFMLTANTAAADLARRRELPFVFRVHEKPDSIKAGQLSAVLKALGVEFQFKKDIPTQAELTVLLNRTRGTPLETPVHNAVLRSMAKAVYKPLPLGHYGLALNDYAHFTSPIRRYPDLLVHRILSDYIQGVVPEMMHTRYDMAASKASEYSSGQEQAALSLERDCSAMYKAEYMRRYIGCSFCGTITSATSFGLYVSLPNTVEGLLHAFTLSDYRLELQEGVALYDAVSKRRYCVGAGVRVKVKSVNIFRGTVDFEPDGRDFYLNG